jgi:hypothetical protein
MTFGGKLGLMQGIVVTTGGDVWILGVEKRQLVHFPKGDLSNGRIVCEGDSAEPCKSFLGPFHLGIDSQGNVWVTNRFGSGLLGMAHLVDMGVHLKLEGVTGASDYLTTVMFKQKGAAGSVNLLRPDGSQYPGSPFSSGGLPGPWVAAVGGNDNVWVMNNWQDIDSLRAPLPS